MVWRLCDGDDDGDDDDDVVIVVSIRDCSNRPQFISQIINPSESGWPLYRGAVLWPTWPVGVLCMNVETDRC